jgi:hypothetical protein
MSMSGEPRVLLRYWFGIIGPVIVVYSLIGLLVEAGVPHLFPENALTTYVGGSAKTGVFVIWFYLIWRIFVSIRGIYGRENNLYLEYTPVWRILLDVSAAYAFAAFCFAVVYVYIARHVQGAFSESLDLGNALYFSIVTMTTTGYGDIAPKSGWTKFVVSVEILFGVLYNVLFFSIFAGLAGRRRAG